MYIGRGGRGVMIFKSYIILSSRADMISTWNHSDNVIVLILLQDWFMFLVFMLLNHNLIMNNKQIRSNDIKFIELILY